MPRLRLTGRDNFAGASGEIALLYMAQKTTKNFPSGKKKVALVVIG